MYTATSRELHLNAVSVVYNRILLYYNIYTKILLLPTFIGSSFKKKSLQVVNSITPSQRTRVWIPYTYHILYYHTYTITTNSLSIP